MQIIEEPVLQFKPHCDDHSRISIAGLEKAERQKSRRGKRKRLISDEGQQQTVDDPCDVCGFKDKDEGNEMVYCENCDVLVHQACYNIPVVPDDDWLCRPCSEGVQPKCVLCNQVKGAMVKTSDGKKWAHVQCVWWLPDIKFVDGKQMEKMESLEKISKRRWKLECCLCKKQKGACIQCSVKGCFKAFHSRCAFKNGFLMQIIQEPVLQLKPHCEEHSKRSVTGTQIAKRRGKRGPHKRLMPEEGRKLQSESLKKKMKVGGRIAPVITLEQITSKNDQGDTCLHVAAQKRDLNQIRHLLDRISKASLIQNCINIQNNKSRTSLFISVLNNDSEIVEILLQHGANPNIFAQATGGHEGQRDAAIHVAASRGNSYLKTVDALLADETISLNSFNTQGYTALHLAVMAHGREISKKENIDSACIIKKLIESGLDPNLQETNTGRTPLMCAIEKLDITLVETFVNLIDNTKMRQLLKSESFDGKNVHSIIEEIKATFTMNDYKKLTDLLKFSTTNDDQLSIGSSGYDSIFSM